MPYVSIPKDLSKLKPRLFFGLNKRQFFCIALAVIVAVPAYFFISYYLNSEVAGWVTVILAVPIFACSFIEKNALPLEKYVLMVIRVRIFGNLTRPYRTENIYRAIQDYQDYTYYLRDKKENSRFKRFQIFKRVGKQTKNDYRRKN